MSEYLTTLSHKMFYQVHYWGYLTDRPREMLHEGQHNFRVAPGGFILLRNDMFSFYRVERVMTVTIGTMIRALSVTNPPNMYQRRVYGFQNNPALHTATHQQPNHGLPPINPQEPLSISGRSKYL